MNRQKLQPNHHLIQSTTYTIQLVVQHKLVMGCCFGKQAEPTAAAAPTTRPTLTGSPSEERRLHVGKVLTEEEKEKRRQRIQLENMSSSVQTVADKNDFDTKLKEAGGSLVVVDFYATWCGPCKMISPKLEEMAKVMTDVIFLKVDVDECEDIASLYGISCMPTFMFFKNGEKVQEFSGANVEKVKEIINTCK